jgi:hypothetical protein
VTADNFGDVAGIPFFVKQPGQAAGRVDDSFVTTLDVLPTVVEALGVGTDWKFDGIPAGEPRDPALLQQRNGREARLVGVPPEEFLRLRDASLADRLERFPPGLDGIWAVGPRQDLVGRPLSVLTPAVSKGEGGFLNNAALYGHVRPGSGVLPVYVTGAWSGIAPGTDLAVAINGRIAATGEAYLEHGDPRFSMLVPPETLRPGANRVEVVAIDGGSARSLVSEG